MSWFHSLRSAVTRGNLKPFRIGWITQDPETRPLLGARSLAFGFRHRAGYVSDWVNAKSRDFHCELYEHRCRYDIVIFLKMMTQRFQEEALRIQAYGGKVVFEANVNYYEIWGDYFVPLTKPTEQQQRDVIWMTTHADWVIADSSYVAGIARKHNPCVSWIPDVVNFDLFWRTRTHAPADRLALVWSGIPRKARHLLHICPALSRVKNADLMLVSGQPGDLAIDDETLRALRAVIPCHVIPFTERRLAKVLAASDVIISPKRLSNGYEMGHTEHKIAFGMAAGLPPIASPQPSYVEAISHRGGGFVVSTIDEWVDALTRLSSWELRRELGNLARDTVLECYSTSVIASRYIAFFHKILGTGMDPKPGVGTQDREHIAVM